MGSAEGDAPVQLVLTTGAKDAPAPAAPLSALPSSPPREDNSPSTSSSLRLAPSLPPETSAHQRVSKINSLATDLLRVVEPLQASLSRLRQALPPEVEVTKLIQCFVLKLDPLMETLTSLVEETDKPPAANNADPAAVSVSATSSLTAFFSEFRKVANKKCAPPTKKAPPPACPKKPPPAVAKKAPPPIKGKAPPPGKTGKKPPPRPGVSVPKLDLEDLSKADCDISLEQIPDPHLIPKAIQWLGISSEKAVGTVWEDLLKADRQSMTARDWRQRYTMNAELEAEEIPALPTVAPNFKFEVRYTMLNELFFQNANEKKKEVEKPLSEALVASARTRSVSCLDPKRTHNIEISLKGCKLYDDFSPIYNTICELNFGEQDASQKSNSEVEMRKKELDPATVHFLSEVYPNPDEIKALKKLATNPPIDQRIAPADQFLLELIKIPRFHERADAVCTKMTFNNDIAVVVDKISKLMKFCDSALHEIREGLLKPIFALILKMGNYINCRTKRALVPGLQMAVLENLRQIRSIDGTKSFTRIVAEHIDDQFPMGWKQLEWLCLCSEAADINPDDTLQILHQLEAKIKRIQTELNHPDVQKDQRFIECFKDFADQSAKRIQDMRGRCDEVRGKLMKLAETLADKAKAPKEALEIFKRLDKFGKDLFNCKKEIETEKNALEKRKHRAVLDRTPLSGKVSAPLLKLKPPSKSPDTSSTSRSKELQAPSSSSSSSSSASTSDLKAPPLPVETTPKTPPRRADLLTVSPSLVPRKKALLHDDFRETPRILKAVATADPCATPGSSRHLAEHSAAIPKSPPAVSVLHGARLSTKDALRLSKQRRMGDLALSKSTPRHLLTESPRDESLFEFRSRRMPMAEEEIVLEEDLGEASASRHKKSRSHAYHKSVKSMQNVLSPESKHADLNEGYYSRLLRDARQQQQNARFLASSRPQPQPPGSSRETQSPYEPWQKKSSRLYPEVVVSGDSSCLEEETETDLQFDSAMLAPSSLGRRGMSRQLNRVAGDIGDEVMSLASQSSFASSNPLGRPAANPQQPGVSSAQQPSPSLAGQSLSSLGLGQSAMLGESPSLLRRRFPLGDGGDGVRPGSQQSYVSATGGRASPQSSRHSAQPLGSIFSLTGSHSMLRANLPEYRQLADFGPRLLPQGPRYPVTNSPPLVQYSAGQQYHPASSGRVSNRVPDFPQQTFWTTRRY